MELRIKKISAESKIPQYAHPGDAGMDLYSSEDSVLEPGKQTTVKTGVSMAIPSGYVGLIWDKSGLAAKHGIKTMAGVVDSGYRGEVCVVMINLGNTSYKIEKHTKIAQLLIQPVNSANVIEVEELDATSRGKGGFGSTGLR